MEDELIVRSQLEALGVVPSEEELRSMVEAYPALRTLLDGLYSIPAVRYEVPAVQFSVIEADG